MPKKKIMFVLPALNTGGAEKVAIDIMNNLAEKFLFMLCLFEKRGPLVTEIPSAVQVFDLKKKKWWSFLKLGWKLRKIIRKQNPEIIVSFLWYSTFIVMLANLFRMKKRGFFIAYEPHNHLQDIKGTRFSMIKSVLIKYVHRKMNLVIVDSKGAMVDIAKNYNLSQDKLKVIYNPINVAEIKKASEEKIADPKINEIVASAGTKLVCFGRLVKRKGFHLAVAALQRVLESMEAKLLIIGEGEERKNLEKMIADLDLKKKILLCGYLSNPYSVISRCDIFVFPSLWEGFGNVIVEVMACGIPVIAAACPYGPDEIITNGVNGILVSVNDENALAEAVIQLANDSVLRKRLADEGKKRAEDFCVEKIAVEYEKIFCNN